MLYKKYHRNYVSQFKKGTKFRWNTENSEVVVIEPYFSNDYHEIHISDVKYGWVLVFSGGKINKNLYVV